MLSARSSAVRARLGNDSKVSIDYIEACGDCFYLAMEAALSESDGWRPLYGVGRQREVVASSMTEETFQLYSQLHAQRCEGASSPRLPSRPGPPSPPPPGARTAARAAADGTAPPDRTGFSFMQGVDNLDVLRARILLRGQKVGGHKCVWADGFAMVCRPPRAAPSARQRLAPPWRLHRKRLPTISGCCCSWSTSALRAAKSSRGSPRRTPGAAA